MATRIENPLPPIPEDLGRFVVGVLSSLLPIVCLNRIF
jgi:hypothetical protein